MQNDQENYQNMLNMAEFAATRMDQRKTVEFRIFISYMTPLILAAYYAIKVAPENVAGVSWWGIAILSIVILIIHIIYAAWQIRVAAAMRNDAQRRNFYLKKAECILHHLSKNTNTHFLPHNNEVKVDFGYGKTSWTEKELFDKDAAEFVPVSTVGVVYKNHCRELWKDWNRPLLTMLPTMMLLLIALILLFKKFSWWLS